jgi:hypothetical protein
MAPPPLRPKFMNPKILWPSPPPLFLARVQDLERLTVYGKQGRKAEKGYTSPVELNNSERSDAHSEILTMSREHLLRLQGCENCGIVPELWLAKDRPIMQERAWPEQD